MDSLTKVSLTKLEIILDRSMAVPVVADVARLYMNRPSSSSRMH